MQLGTGERKSMHRYLDVAFEPVSHGKLMRHNAIESGTADVFGFRDQAPRFAFSRKPQHTVQWNAGISAPLDHSVAAAAHRTFTIPWAIANIVLV
ncbi:MAG TPA: hypothetical protein VLI55_17680 [Bryobacteraceae bacterium]|nr:hypothetical protein [Bryobacteraceae bacterium]